MSADEFVGGKEPYWSSQSKFITDEIYKFYGKVQWSSCKIEVINVKFSSVSFLVKNQWAQPSGTKRKHS